MNLNKKYSFKDLFSKTIKFEHGGDILSIHTKQLSPMYKNELKKIDKLPQTQISTTDQLNILWAFANKLGLYDAADFLKNNA